MENPAVSRWVEAFLKDRPIRANSLIITIYGDLIAPHGGAVWLGSFIKLVNVFGINDRLVRTSVFRLAKDNWLTSEHVGRRSYYGLTPTGKRRFEHAHRRIYFQQDAHWEGEWQIVLMSSGDIAPEQREDVRKELLWEGFGMVAPGVLAHPSTDTAPLTDILRSNGVQDKIVVLLAKSLDAHANKPVRELVKECWNLGVIAQDYQRFLERFGPVLKALKTSDRLDPEQCFVIRTLLMHEYRRTLLRDPQLPEQLLPNDWPGSDARQLCQTLYALTFEEAENHLLSVLETASGRLPEATPHVFKRFGGINTEAQIHSPLIAGAEH